MKSEPEAAQERLKRNRKQKKKKDSFEHWKEMTKETKRIWEQVPNDAGEENWLTSQLGPPKKKTRAREGKWEKLVQDSFLDTAGLKLNLNKYSMCLRIWT